MGFGGFLKQSTAVDVLIGPFVDSTDGDTEETALTISQADVRLSKNGQAGAQKNDVTAAAHDADGFYNCELDATDTNTVGQLTLYVHEAGALAVRHDYQIVEESTYDFLYIAGATPIADINAEADTALADYDSPTKAEMDTAHALLATEAKQDIIDTNVDDIETDLANATDGLGALKALIDTVNTDLSNGTDGLGALKSLIDGLLDPSLAAIADAIWDEAVAGHVAAGSFGKTDADILVDTNELQGDWVNAGRLDTLLDAIPTTAMRGTDNASTLTAAQVNTEVDTAWTTQMADSVPADGTISTREQAMYAVLQMLTEFVFSGTTMTVKKVDGSTTLMTFTLSDSSNPTSLTRAT